MCLRLLGRGLGELFIVRNAGNTIDTAALGSVEYGVGVLGCPLIVVLGHESCGAVAAALDVVERNASFPGVIGEMIQPIIPAVLAARGEPGDPLDAAVRANARRVAGRLRMQSPVLHTCVDGHTALQPPQFIGSLRTSIQAVPHNMFGLVQAGAVSSSGAMSESPSSRPASRTGRLTIGPSSAQPIQVSAKSAATNLMPGSACNRYATIGRRSRFFLVVANGSSARFHAANDPPPCTASTSTRPT